MFDYSGEGSGGHVLVESEAVMLCDHGQIGREKVRRVVELGRSVGGHARVRKKGVRICQLGFERRREGIEWRNGSSRGLSLR